MTTFSFSFSGELKGIVLLNIIIILYVGMAVNVYIILFKLILINVNITLGDTFVAKFTKSLSSRFHIGSIWIQHSRAYLSFNLNSVWTTHSGRYQYRIKCELTLL